MPNRWRQLCSVVTACAALLFNPAGAAAADDEILLGQSASLSGNFATQAASYRDGALAYFAAINAKGGVRGRRFRLLTLDDGYAVERAVANTRRFIDDERVLALFGYTWTNTVKASIPLATEAGVPMVAPYTGYQELYGRQEPMVFTTRAGFSDELAHIVRHLRTLGTRRVALLHYDSLSGRELLAETQQLLRDAQMQLSGVGTMKAGSSDTAAAVQALAQTDMQALIVGASGSDAVAFIRAFERASKDFRAGRRTPYYARSLIGSRQLADELGPLAVGIMVSQTAPNPFKSRAPVAAEYRRLLAQLDARLRPDHIGLEGMIAAKVLVEAVRRSAGRPTRSSIVQGMQRLNDLDVGGYRVSFGPGRHHGSRFVDMTMIGDGGKMVD
jgi:branched-chain amino acid transport system substrate-binding protein